MKLEQQTIDMRSDRTLYRLIRKPDEHLVCMFQLDNQTVFIDWDKLVEFMDQKPRDWNDPDLEGRPNPWEMM